MTGRHRTFDESQVRRWPADSPDSRGGQFAPETATAAAPTWVQRTAVAIAEIAQRRSGGLDYQPGKWFRDTRPNRIARRAEEIYHQTAGDASPALRRQIATDIATREAEVWADRVSYFNGPHEVAVATDKDFDHAELLRLVDELLVTNPPDDDAPVSVTVQTPDRMVLDGDDTWGQVPHGTSIVWLSDAVFDDPYRRQRGEGAPEHFMPAADATATLDYVLAHEWGHVLDGTRVSPAYGDSMDAILDDAGIHLAGQKPAPLHHEHDRALLASVGTVAKKAENKMSTYGRTNDLEAYAEAFAEWYTSRGQTTNQLARAYARRFGWKARP